MKTHQGTYTSTLTWFYCIKFSVSNMEKDTGVSLVFCHGYDVYRML